MAKPAKTLTAVEARKAVRWFQQQMGIGDWSIKVVYADGGSDDGQLGLASAQPPYKRATVIVWPTEHLAGDDDMLSTVMHECCHVMAEDVGAEVPNGQTYEYTWNRLGDLLAAAYRAGVGA